MEVEVYFLWFMEKVFLKLINSQRQVTGTLRYDVMCYISADADR